MFVEMAMVGGNWMECGLGYYATWEEHDARACYAMFCEMGYRMRLRSNKGEIIASN